MKAQQINDGGLQFTRIEHDELVSRIYHPCPVLGVPPNGRAVEADAFVLGKPAGIGKLTRNGVLTLRSLAFTSDREA